MNNRIELELSTIETIDFNHSVNILDNILDDEMINYIINLNNFEKKEILDYWWYDYGYLKYDYIDLNKIKWHKYWYDYYCDWYDYYCDNI